MNVRVGTRVQMAGNSFPEECSPELFAMPIRQWHDSHGEIDHVAFSSFFVLLVLVGLLILRL